MDISAIVLTCDEEQNIARCLSSLNFCREIIVVDSGSQDQTVQIASQFTDKVFHHPMEGHGSQLNWGIEQSSCDWIFSLDADEEVSTQLKQSILEIELKEKIHGYYINRITQYLGRWIKHSGWYPQYILRLFDKRHGRCNDAAIHKSIIVDGPTGKIAGDILHYSYRDLSHHLRKIDQYTTSTAAERYNQGRRFNLAKAIFAPLGEFCKKYLLKMGLLDGFPGFALACASAYYVFLKQAKLYEYQKVMNENKAI